MAITQRNSTSGDTAMAAVGSAQLASYYDAPRVPSNMLTRAHHTNTHTVVQRFQDLLPTFVRTNFRILSDSEANFFSTQRKKISDQTQVTGRFLGGQGLDETRNQARRAFVLTHLETWCQVNFL